MCNNLIKIEETLFLSLSNKYITKFLHSNLINNIYFPVQFIAWINYLQTRETSLLDYVPFPPLEKSLYTFKKILFQTKYRKWALNPTMKRKNGSFFSRGLWHIQKTKNSLINFILDPLGH